MKKVVAMVEKKNPIVTIWAAQHPVMNVWMVVSFACLGFLYAVSFFTF